MRVISVRNETYERLKKVKNLLKAKSFGKTIDKLVDVFYEECKRCFLKLIEETRLPEKEVKKVEEAVKKIENREWW